MKRIMISAMSSGSGKTLMTTALLKAFCNRGIQTEEFKCGPDYIDPMFGRRLLGIPCKNLDLFLQGEEGLKRSLQKQRGELAILEGAMGYYDGIGGSTDGSAWQIAALTKTPVILLLRPSGVGITLAAQIKGMMEFRKPNQIAGILLNDCKPSLYRYLKSILERECHIPVLGYLPHMEEARLESRHLGLVMADEIGDFDQRIQRLAEALEEFCDLDALLSLCAETEVEQKEEAVSFFSLDRKEKEEESNTQQLERQGNLNGAQETRKRCLDDQKLKRQSCLEEEHKIRLAVARDEAFCFYYEENIEALERAGAEIKYFSPLRDEVLPETDALYLSGGYPELHARELGENESMRSSIRKAAEDGLPLLAECGGFLYLQKSLGGQPMVGLFPGNGFETKHLQRFGYLQLHAERDSMLFRAGEEIPAHEFHYWDTDENGTDLLAKKVNGKSWKCAFCSDALYAGFPHLHFGGKLPLAERFVEAGRNYRQKKLKSRKA